MKIFFKYLLLNASKRS